MGERGGIGGAFPNKRYQVIYADPPWKFNSGIRSSRMTEGGKFCYYRPDTTVGPGRYDVMEATAIMALPVGSIAADDCVLFMWTTDAHLPIALEVMSAWGLPYRTVGFIWNKMEKSGRHVCYYGKWTLKGSELCLLGARGRANSMIKSHRVRQLIEAVRVRGVHSRKPGEVRERIVELMGDRPRIELFARERAEGWDSWGDGITGD